MFTRLVSFTETKDIDGGIAFVRDVVTPVLRSQRGWRGTTANADRSGENFAVLTLWETAADRDASESALLKVRDEGDKIIGGQVGVEYFEQVHVEFVAPPTVGSSLLITRVSMEPAKVAENLDYFAREVLPQIKAVPGFLALRHLVNRETGDAVVGTVWADVDTMQAAAKAAEERQRSGAMPVTVRERSEREVVFVDLP